MSSFFIDSPLELRSPVVLGVETAGEPQSHVYFSRFNVDAVTKDVIIIVAMNKNVPTPLLSHGVRAHVSGDAVHVGDVVVVQNPTLRVGVDNNTSSTAVAFKDTLEKLMQICPDLARSPELQKISRAIETDELAPHGTKPGLSVKEVVIGEGGVPTWSLCT